MTVSVRRALVICIVSALLQPVGAAWAATGASASTSGTPLQAFVDMVVSAKLGQFHLPGLGISIVRDGKVVLQKGYGYANAERKIPLSVHTTWSLAEVHHLLVKPEWPASPAGIASASAARA